MQVKIFKPFKLTSDTFQGNYVGVINNVISFSATKNYQSIGDFELSFSMLYYMNIDEDYVLYVVDGNVKHWLIVRNVAVKNKVCSVTGTDLKGLLSYRVTLYGKEQDTGTYGYDVVQGTTEECCRHYVKNNAIAPEDNNRKIPRLLFAGYHGYGLKNDTYMSRFETLSDVIEKLCSNAGVYWDIYGDLENDCFRFEVLNTVDKSSLQAQRNQVVFSVERKNIIAMERVKGGADYKNVFYATKTGGTLESDATTILVTRDTEIAKGVDRKEMQLNVSCDTVSEIKTYALHETTDYIKTDSLTADISDIRNYGITYEIGDKVTVVCKDLNLKIDSVITSVAFTRSKSEKTIKITVGDATPKLLKRINTKINNKGV